MQCVIFVLLTLFSDVLCKPYKHKHRQRHDLDHNGVPDTCFAQGSVTSCLLPDGSWTALATAALAAAETSVVTVHISPTPAAQSNHQWTVVPAQSTGAAAATSSNQWSIVPAQPSGILPSPSQFKLDKGTKWTLELKGNLEFDGPLGSKNVIGDKARTGKIGDKVIWNFGDVMCAGGLEVCGFGWGPGWYGTDDLMLVNSSLSESPQQAVLVRPWHGDETPQLPQANWGMDTSNVVPLNDTHGIAYAWEIWRGAADGSIVDRGNAVAMITLGDDGPIANRTGPLLTGPGYVQIGMLASLRDGEYIYSYSIGGPSTVIVGRVPANEDVFDSTRYEFLLHDDTTTWVPGVPKNDTTTIGMVTEELTGGFGCGAYGSIFFNTYLQKYVMMCSIYMTWVNMYVSDTPYGPFSAAYAITSSNQDGLIAGSYGAMAHPEYGDGQQFHFSIGPNTVFQMFAINFNY